MKNMNVLISIILSIGLVGCGGGGKGGALYGGTKPAKATTGAVTGVASGSMSNKLLANTSSNKSMNEVNPNSPHRFEDAHKMILERFAREKVEGMSSQEMFDKAMTDSATVTLSGSYSCLGGGTAAIDGTMTFSLSSSGPMSFVMSYSMDIDETLTNCIENSYTLNGNIGMHTATGQFNVDITDPVANSTFGASYHFPVSGTLDISGPESYTGCVIDILSTMVMNGSFSTNMSFSSSTTGTVCGSSVNESYSYTYTAD